MNQDYGTLSETVNALKSNGYTLDLNIQDECLACNRTNTVLSPEEFEIDAVYRFEGESNPDDEAIVYAISSPKFGVKGVLVNAYGKDADPASQALVQKLNNARGAKLETPVPGKEKPIKRNKNILPLSKDHHFTLLFAWKIRQGLKHGIDPERIKPYVQQFWNENMSVHFKEEEEILFAPLPDDKVQRAIREHQEIKTKIDQVLAAASTDLVVKLNSLADAVDAHVRYEERELFPHLEKCLSTQQLEKIGKTLEGEPLLKDDFQDEFWIRPR